MATLLNLSGVSLKHKQNLLLVLLIIAGFFGNYFKLTLFFGVDFLFGSISVLLVVAIYGCFWGTIAAIVSSSCTYLMWGHPYAIVIFTCEALFVGLYSRKKSQNLLLLDGIYWVLLGMPLVAILYGGLLKVSVIGTCLILVKQAVNGFFNALVCSLIVNYFPVDKWLGKHNKHTISWQQSLFNLLIAFVFFPVMAININNSTRAVENIETEIIQSINFISLEFKNDLVTWKDNNIRILNQIANYSALQNKDGRTQETLENIQTIFPQFNQIYVVNRLGEIVAVYPPNLKAGINFSQRHDFHQLREKLSLVTADIFLTSSEGKSYEVFNLGLPIIKNNKFDGAVLGEIKIEELNKIIKKQNITQNFNVTIIDEKNRVIATNIENQKILQSFNPYQNKRIQTLNNNVTHLLPNLPNMPAIWRWEKSLYSQISPLNNIFNLKLVIEIPTKPKIDYIRKVYIKNLGIMLITAFMALIAAIILSNKLVRPVLILTQITTDLPQKILAQEEIILNNSNIAEIDSLTRNFQSMILALHQMFQDIKNANDQLEERVRIRTQELLIINDELADEIIGRQNVETILREREERYKLAISGTNDGLWDWNLNTDEVYYSPAWMRIIGYDDESLPHVLSTWLDHVYPDELEKVIEVVKDHLEGKTDFYEHTYRIKHRNGNYIWISARGKCIRNEQNKAYRLVGTITDITEKKIAEEQLESAKEDAEIANKTKSEFLAMMSHEIRTPMNAVIGMTGLLLDTELTSQQQEFVEIIRNSGDAMLTLINDILDFSKIESGKLEIEKQTFNIRTCIEESLDLVAPQACKKGLELNYLMPSESYEIVLGDVTRVRQILVNLLGNAIKFTNVGGVIVSVDIKTINNINHQLYEIIFTVTDTGIGIPEDRMERLFKPFSQVDASTTRNYGGTGLGLVISQRLTELMGGKMWVESTVGQGSKFYFTIITSFVERTFFIDKNKYQGLIDSKRLLIIDDNVTNLQALKLQVESFGMIAVCVASGKEAIALLEQQHYDLAIIDMQMPEMDGLTLAADIHKLPNYHQLPLVMMTSIGADYNNKNLTTGNVEVAAYLTKPIKKSHFWNTLVNIFSNDVMPKENLSNFTSSKFDPLMAEKIPLKILVAEDNVVNQKVAINILQRLGYRADVAANGLEVLTSLRRQHYDVVLMDVQMPEMDGLMATQHICEEWPLSSRPWIIAMTANAMQGDREKCLALGMNDYTTKPIRVDELTSALRNCHKHNLNKDQNPVSISNDILDEGVLTELREIICSGIQEEFVQIIESYLDDTPQRLRSLDDAINQGNAKTLQLEAHALKSSSAILGATSLSQLFLQLETLGRAENTTDADLLLSQAMGQFEQVKSALHVLISN
ncbi:response regulator [Cronbergia sp. UHCC 0137]|uniref:response regulator n=1 Tax=Cronbergia sp. UHCC 0137 TaxID=3110239 RepID=UPI002B1FAC3A|nr:response regulator [Cronbergia sp. UHCC 0137]MEA5617563.1 response regulator [Cronbergia sp. UHCC 0137]